MGEYSMQYAKQMLGGVCTALLMWGVMIIADLIDEFILDESLGVTGVVFFAAPVVMFIWYVIHCCWKKPDIWHRLAWHVFYSVSFAILWIFGNIGGDVRFGIPQKYRSEWIDLNGVEYAWYGFPALFAFLILCILFLGFRKIVEMLKGQRKSKEGEKEI